MTGKKIDIISGLLSGALLISLIIKLANVPGGIILSGFFLGGIIIVGILLGCLILTGILKLLFKKISSISIYSITTAIGFIIFHYTLYSPKLTIIVPNGFTGRVSLVLSNVDNNILAVDTNGIGYIDEETFESTYVEPIVLDQNGKPLNDYCVGFNPSTFWGNGKAGSSENKTEVEYLSFEIVSNKNIGQKQYYHADLTVLVDKTKLIKK